MSSVSADMIYQNIAIACNPTEERQRQAMDQLEAFGACAGFIPSVLQIVSQTTGVSKDCRLMAVICLKNVVKRRWRGRGADVVPDDEKEMLRNFCMNYWDEPEDRVESQLAYLLSDLIRKDWPDSWPNAMLELTTHTQSTDQNVAFKSMIRLYHVLMALLPLANAHLKKFASENFATFATILLQLSPQFTSTLQNLLSSPSPTSIARDSSFEMMSKYTCVTANIVCTMLKLSFKEISAMHDMNNFLTSFLHEIKSQHGYVVAISDHIRVGDSIPFEEDFECEGPWDDTIWGLDETYKLSKSAIQTGGFSIRRMLTVLTSVACHLVDNNPLEIAPFLTPFLDLAHEMLLSEYGESTDPTRAAVDAAAGERAQHCVPEFACIKLVLVIYRSLRCPLYNR